MWPANPEMDFYTNDETLSYVEDIDLSLGAAALTAYTYNLDDTYEHTITVRVVVMPPEEQSTWIEQAKELLGIGQSG